MPHRPSATDAYQRQRWLRHDAHLWMQPNPGRFLKPGTDPADVYPALALQRDQARQRDAAKAAALQAKIEEGFRLIATLRAEVASIRADMARRRAFAIKYTPAQPRVPTGNPRGGQ